MLTTCPVRPERRAAIPAVVHVDGSARVQLVEPIVGHPLDAAATFVRSALDVLYIDGHRVERPR